MGGVADDLDGLDHDQAGGGQLIELGKQGPDSLVGVRWTISV
jgi:hypothetical protein